MIIWIDQIFSESHACLIVAQVFVDLLGIGESKIAGDLHEPAQRWAMPRLSFRANIQALQETCRCRQAASKYLNRYP